MKYRKFGNTGLELSEIGFGAWALGGGWGDQRDEDSIAALHKALDMGLNFIDTAQGYGEGRSERLIGQVLKERSENITVATKTPPVEGLWPPSPYCNAEERYPDNYLRENIETRLNNLGTECIDILQLHTWTRAWNKDPKPLETLQQLRKEGKIRFIGISTPEQDQNSVIDLMRNGLVDVVQVIYNIFEQEPAAELLPVAEETGTGVIVRVAFDEGVLTGKFCKGHRFAEDDFRSDYFAGDRIDRAIERVERIQADVEADSHAAGMSLADVALKFVLAHSAVGTVIPGIRNVQQAEMNLGVSDKPDLSDTLLKRLQKHYWLKGVWYSGK